MQKIVRLISSCCSNKNLEDEEKNSKGEPQEPSSYIEEPTPQELPHESPVEPQSDSSHVTKPTKPKRKRKSTGPPKIRDRSSSAPNIFQSNKVLKKQSEDTQKTSPQPGPVEKKPLKGILKKR